MLDLNFILRDRLVSKLYRHSNHQTLAVLGRHAFSDIVSYDLSIRRPDGSRPQGWPRLNFASRFDETAFKECVLTIASGRYGPLSTPPSIPKLKRLNSECNGFAFWVAINVTLWDAANQVYCKGRSRYVGIIDVCINMTLSGLRIFIQEEGPQGLLERTQSINREVTRNHLLMQGAEYDATMRHKPDDGFLLPELFAPTHC